MLQCRRLSARESHGCRIVIDDVVLHRTRVSCRNTPTLSTIPILQYGNRPIPFSMHLSYHFNPQVYSQINQGDYSEASFAEMKLVALKRPMCPN